MTRLVAVVGRNDAETHADLGDRAPIDFASGSECMMPNITPTSSVKYIR